MADCERDEDQSAQTEALLLKVHNVSFIFFSLLFYLFLSYIF